MNNIYVPKFPKLGFLLLLLLGLSSTTIYAKDLPPHTTSNIAGGQWAPTSVIDRTRRTAESDALLVRASRLSHRSFQQLTFLLPQPEVDYMVIAEGLYMFPRRDGILLGGTFQHNVWSLDVDEEARRRIVTGHRSLFDGMR